jgi:hypothetical protein
MKSKLAMWYISWGGVRLSLLGTSVSFWPIVLASDDGWWWWMWSSRWNEWQGKPNYSEKTCPSAALSTTNPTWSDLGSNPSRRSGKTAIIRLSYGMASYSILPDRITMRTTTTMAMCFRYSVFPFSESFLRMKWRWVNCTKLSFYGIELAIWSLSVLGIFLRV